MYCVSLFTLHFLSSRNLFMQTANRRSSVFACIIRKAYVDVLQRSHYSSCFMLYKLGDAVAM